MKIGVVVDNEFVNDIRVRTECDILKSGGHDVYVLHFNFSKEATITVDGLIQKEVYFDRKKKDILYATMNWNPMYENMWAREVSTFINEFDLDVIHTHDLYMSRACKEGILKSNKSDLKLILDLHENYPHAIQLYNWATKFPRNYIVRAHKWFKKEKEYLNYADRIIVLSDYFAKDLSGRNDLSLDKFFTFPNVPDINRLASFESKPDVLDKENGVIRLFYFGAVAERRGIFLVLEAFKELVKEIKVDLLIVGPVDKKDKPRFDQELSENKKVIYKPWIDISELPSFIENCDICLSPLDKNPQHESGVANKVYQYMYFAKALLVSDCGPQAELLTENNCGLVHKFNSQEDFKKAVLKLAKNPNDLTLMGKNAKKAILDVYNSENYSKKLLNMYSGIK